MYYFSTRKVGEKQYVSWISVCPSFFECARLGRSADANTHTLVTVGQSQHDCVVSTHSVPQIYTLGRSCYLLDRQWYVFQDFVHAHVLALQEYLALCTQIS